MSIGRAVREATLALYRTGTVGALSCLAIGASLLLIGMFAQLLDGARLTAASLKDRIEVEIYLRDGATRRAATALAEDLRSLDGVRTVDYIDKAAATEEFEAMFGKDLLSALSTNPLPASLRIGFEPDASVRSAAEAVSALAADHRDVEQVETGDAWLSQVERVVDLGLWVGLLLTTLLCLACGFAVSNTAKLMVLAQRDAIEIMRVVGASNAFIRTTFMMGGGLQGTAGGFLAALAVTIGSPLWAAAVPVESALSTSLIGVGLIALGAILGVLGSWASLSRVLQAIA